MIDKASEALLLLVRLSTLVASITNDDIDRAEVTRTADAIANDAARVRNDHGLGTNEGTPTSTGDCPVPAPVGASHEAIARELKDERFKHGMSRGCLDMIREDLVAFMGESLEHTPDMMLNDALRELVRRKERELEKVSAELAHSRNRNLDLHKEMETLRAERNDAHRAFGNAAIFDGYPTLDAKAERAMAEGKRLSDENAKLRQALRNAAMKCDEMALHMFAVPGGDAMRKVAADMRRIADGAA